MNPKEYAEKIVHDYGVALDADSDGLVEELQAACLVLAGMVLALTAQAKAAAAPSS